MKKLDIDVEDFYEKCRRLYLQGMKVLIENPQALESVAGMVRTVGK